MPTHNINAYAVNKKTYFFKCPNPAQCPNEYALHIHGNDQESTENHTNHRGSHCKSFIGDYYLHITDETIRGTFDIETGRRTA